MSVFIDAYNDDSGNGCDIMSQNLRNGVMASKELDSLIASRISAHENTKREMINAAKKMNPKTGVHTFYMEPLQQTLEDISTETAVKQMELSTIKEKIPHIKKNLLKTVDDPPIKIRDKMLAAHTQMNKAKKTNAKEASKKYFKAKEAYDEKYKTFAMDAENHERETIINLQKVMNEWIDCEMNALNDTLNAWAGYKAQLESIGPNECIRLICSDENKKLPTRSLTRKSIGGASVRSGLSGLSRRGSVRSTTSRKTSVSQNEAASHDTGGDLLDLATETPTDIPVQITPTVLQPIQSMGGEEMLATQTAANSTTANDAPLVDDEGYSIAPPSASTPPAVAAESDSDFDTSDEEEDTSFKPKIMVKISGITDQKSEQDLGLYKLGIPDITSAKAAAGRINNRRRDRSASNRATTNGALDFSGFGQPAEKGTDAVSLGSPERAGSPVASIDPPASSVSVQPLQPAQESGSSVLVPSKPSSVESFNFAIIPDTPPVARKNIECRVAVMESINAYFKEAALGKLIITGQVILSFPSSAGDTSMSGNAVFTLKNFDMLTKISGNPAIFENPSKVTNENNEVVLPWEKLKSFLAKDHTVGGTSDQRITLLSYEVSKNDISLLPLRLCSRWKQTEESSNLEFHYLYNKKAIGVPLTGVSILTTFNGESTSCKSDPNGKWNADRKTLLWSFPAVTPEAGPKKTHAEWATTSKPAPSKVLVKFSGTGSTISTFSIGYSNDSIVKFSQIVERFTADKYISDF